MTRQAFEQTSTHDAAVVGGADGATPEIDSAAASRSRRAQSADFRAAVDAGGVGQRVARRIIAQLTGGSVAVTVPPSTSTPSRLRGATES